MSRKPRSKSKNPLIDVVIPTAGRFDMLTKCLEVIYREAQQVPLTISVVDIDSPAEERISNSQLFVYQAEKDPAHNVTQFQTKRFTQNVGFPTGANDGAKMGRAPLIMFLNDDVELEEGAIQKVMDSFKDETVGIVGIKLLFPLNSPDAKGRPAGKIQHIGLALNIRGEPIHPLVGWSPDNPKTQGNRDVWAVTGACLTVRRDLFQRLNGFDLVYGKGTYEDVDLCVKVKQAGKRIYMNADAIGYHYTGASAEKRREGFPLQQNLQIFQSRWGQSGLMVWNENEYW
jgi:GT2 family glycosyltransferase